MRKTVNLFTLCVTDCVVQVLSLAVQEIITVTEPKCYHCVHEVSILDPDLKITVCVCVCVCARVCLRTHGRARTQFLRGGNIGNMGDTRSI